MHIKFIEILGNKVVFFDGHLRFFCMNENCTCTLLTIFFLFFYISERSSVFPWMKHLDAPQNSFSQWFQNNENTPPSMTPIRIRIEHYLSYNRERKTPLKPMVLAPKIQKPEYNTVFNLKICKKIDKPIVYLVYLDINTLLKGPGAMGCWGRENHCKGHARFLSLPISVVASANECALYLKHS